MRLRPAHEADQDEAATYCQTFQIVVPVHGADEIFDDVHAAAVCVLVHPIGESPLLIVTPRGGAEFDAAGDLFGRSRGDQDVRPGLARHLNAGRADPAGPGMDEDGLAGSKLRQGEQRLLRGEEHFGHGRGLGKAPAGRHGHRHAGVEHCLFRVPTTAHQAEYAVADVHVTHG